MAADVAGIINGVGTAASAVFNNLGAGKRLARQELAAAKTKVANDMVAESNATRQAAMAMSAQYDKGSGMQFNMLQEPEPIVPKAGVDFSALADSIDEMKNKLTNAFANITPPTDKVDNQPASAVKNQPVSNTGGPSGIDSTVGKKLQGGRLKLQPRFNIHNFKYNG